MAGSIADIRKNYTQQSLSENDAEVNPIQQFSKWWDEAVASDIDEVNAMTLATASSDGIPSARIVLLKEYDINGFTFFTNYNSFKGQQLAENPKACLVFFWKELERQVRITGLIEKISSAASDEYFNSRPQGSQVGAIASPQSPVIENREWKSAGTTPLLPLLDSTPFATHHFVPNGSLNPNPPNETNPHLPTSPPVLMSAKFHPSAPNPFLG